MSENTIDDLLSAARRRIAAFTEGGDMEAVLGDDALELAESLLRAARHAVGGPQLDLALTGGFLRLTRYLAQPGATATTTSAPRVTCSHS